MKEEEMALRPVIVHARPSGCAWLRAILVRFEVRSPEGLRHGYGVAAISAAMPLNMLRKWMGRAQIKTTAIYGNGLGGGAAQYCRPEVAIDLRAGTYQQFPLVEGPRYRLCYRYWA
jgi:hypothetical protein